MQLLELGPAIRARREALGLTQARLAHLSGLSRQTVAGLEAGQLADLGFNRVNQLMAVLGLDWKAPPEVTAAARRGLRMAARTASTSYAQAVTPETLSQVLATGEVPPAYGAHLTHLLDEAPVSLVVMAVEDVAAQEHLSPRSVWHNVGKIARTLAVHRQSLWA